MNSPTIIPFQPRHLESLRVLAGIAEIQDALVYGKTLSVKGTAFTAVKDGKILGAAGVLPLWKGVGEAWAMFPLEFRKMNFFLHRSVKKFLEEIQQEWPFHRIQANVRYDFLEGHKWIKALGFIKEGPLYQYGADGATYIRYSRLGV